MSFNSELGHNPSIAVIGGGLVGPATGLFLESAGFTDVQVYEASPANQEVSGGAFGVTAATADKLEQLKVTRTEIATSPTTETKICTVGPDGGIISSETKDFGSIQTTWDVAHKAFAGKIAIQYKKQAARIADNGRSATVFFSDGSKTETDLVICADGRNSLGRQTFNPGQSQYRGYVVWRGLTESPSPTPDCLTQFQNTKEGVLFVGDPITQGMHEGLTDWTLYQKLSAMEFEDLMGIPPNKRYYIRAERITPNAKDAMNNYARERFPGYLADMIESTGAVALVPMLEVPMPRQAIWRIGRLGRVILLSDALAPLPPNTGQGFNNGIRQAKSLVEALSVGKDAALKEWEGGVVRQVAHWVRKGRERAQAIGLQALV